jgi:hypothetical protein
MRIGITTFQWADNYGALLQAHALQTFLQARGHEVQIVDYRPQRPRSLVRRWFSASPRGCAHKWEANWKKFLFERFRKKNLGRTPEVFQSASELRKISDRFDLLIAGSDQVWNPKWLAQVDGLTDLYFLSFAGQRSRRISYAASIGHSDLSTMKEEWQKILAERMKAMDAISVREQSGVELVRQLCGRTDAVCVADPTFLLDANQWAGVVGSRKRKGKYIFSFMLHGLEQDASVVCGQMAGKKEIPVFKCDARRTPLHKGYVLPSPAGWLRWIRGADFVVTNSFHCTVFCLIFHVPFVAVLIDGTIGSMNSRITDLLKAVGLSPRAVAAGVELPTGIVTGRIDWGSVDQAVASMRIGAVGFLGKYLEQ